MKLTNLFILLHGITLTFSACSDTQTEEKGSAGSAMKCGTGKCGTNMFDGKGVLAKKKKNILSQMRDNDPRKACIFSTPLPLPNLKIPDLSKFRRGGKSNVLFKISEKVKFSNRYEFSNRSKQANFSKKVQLSNRTILKSQLSNRNSQIAKAKLISFSAH